MDKFDRIYALHGIFSMRRYPVAMQTLCEKLECSPSCVKRILGEMKDYLSAPIRNKRGVGYFYNRDMAFELPGVWFNTSEMEALMVISTFALFTIRHSQFTTHPHRAGCAVQFVIETCKGKLPTICRTLSLPDSSTNSLTQAEVSR